MTKDRDLAKAVQRTSTVILAGGRGTRLMGLTDAKAKPAVPFGGDFRIIDFTLSNCVNSGFRKISVLTQYQAAGLEEYVKDWASMRSVMNEAVDVLPSLHDEGYRGTADALYQNLDALSRHDADWVLILAGDHIYKMDYAAMLRDHIEKGADLTIPCAEVPRMDATGFGVMDVDDTNRIRGFLEKPADPPGMPGKPDSALASMGIYIFNKKFLFEELRRDAKNEASSHDFGKDLIPQLVPRAQLYAHLFSGSCVRKPENEAYWRDVGTVDAYWAANMDMTSENPYLDVHDRAWPVYTRRENLPPARVPAGCAGTDSIVSGGCIVGDSEIKRSVLSRRVRVGRQCRIEDSVLLPGVTVGRSASLKNAVVDTDCEIPEGLIVGEDAEADARRFYRTDNGIVLINQSMLAQLAQ